MPNANIPLSVQTPQIGEGIMQLAQIQRQGLQDKIAQQDRQLALQDRSQEREARDLQIQSAKNQLTEQEEKSVVMGAIPLKGYLERDDKEGALKYLEGRLTALQSGGRNPEHTLAAIRAIKEGRIQEVLKSTNDLFDMGVQRGWLQAPAQQETFEPLTDANGNVVAQRNTVTGEVKSDPRASQSQQQKAPQGFRYRQDGSLEPIPGGPADIAQQEKQAEQARTEQETAVVQQEVQQAAQGKIREANTKTRIVANKVDEAIGIIDKNVNQGLKGFISQAIPGSNVAGLGGAVMSLLPGTEATNLENTIRTVKSVLGFQELQAMRDASPTGGALGQVSEREIDFLQSAVASMDVGQDVGQLIENLKAVKVHVQNWRNAVEEANRGILPEKETQPKVIDFNDLP